jgi:hypothetical protein
LSTEDGLGRRVFFYVCEWWVWMYRYVWCLYVCNACIRICGWV